MTWDNSAILQAISEPERMVALGPDPRVLHPFHPHLTGSVLLLGAAPEVFIAALRETAQAVAIGEAPKEEALFDAVVLIAPPSSSKPGADRLGGAVAHLKPGGRLIVVVENALSLRRLAEQPMTAGLAALVLPEKEAAEGAVPPSRRGLRERLAGIGLAEQAWWFPFPSHRLALSLISEHGAVPDAAAAFDPGILAADAAPFDPAGPGEGRSSLRDAWTGAARAGLLGDVAPAFAVAASAMPLPLDPRLAVHFGHRRRPAFDKAVSFARCGDGIRVRRAPLHPSLPRTVAGVTNLFPEESYCPGVPWQAGLRTLLSRDGWTVADLVAWAGVWWDAVRRLQAGGADLTLGAALPGTAIDAIPRNLLHREGQPVFIDAEWKIDDLDASHLLVRGLINAFTDIEICGAPGPGLGASLLPLVRAVAEGLGLPLDGPTLDEALARESRFQTTVSGIAAPCDRAWLAATRLPIRPAPPAPVDPLAARDRTLARLETDMVALRAEGERRVAALTEELEEARLRTDRVIRYAADLDRERGCLRVALGEAQDRADRLEAAARQPPPRTRPLTGALGALFAARRGRSEP